MEWSQLKKRIEGMFAESVKGRVELRQTRYHKAHDQLGRAWITIDGKEIINMCEFIWEAEHSEESRRIREARDITDFRHPGYFEAGDRATEVLHDHSIFSRWEFHASLVEYLQMSIDQILSSPNPMIRAVGMLDRRMGKRRLARVDASSEHALVRRMHDFRCESELAEQKARPKPNSR